MTLTTTARRVEYLANGISTMFAVPFQFRAAADVQVTGGGAYTLTGAGSPAGGTLTFAVPPAAGEQIGILRVVQRTQETAYVPNDPFPAKAHEAALDKLTMIAQEDRDEIIALDQKTESALASTVRVPSGSLAPIVPQGGKVIGFDAAGQPVLMAQGGADGALRTDLAGASGAAMVGAAAGTSVQVLLDRLGAVWAVAPPPTGGDDSLWLNAFIAAAFAANRNVFLPAGAYQANVVLPAVAAKRNKSLKLWGQGMGEIFALSKTDGSTSITGVDPAQEVIRFENLEPGYPWASPGYLDIAHLRLYQTSDSKAVMRFKSLMGQHEIHHIAMIQHGAGDGLVIQASSTAEVYNCYAINRDWNVPSDQQNTADRQGTGFVAQGAFPAGLTAFRRCTARGWYRGYEIGLDDPATAAYGFAIEHSEVSNCRHGVAVNARARSTRLSHLYMEGGDGGTGIDDRGMGTVVENSILFFGFGIGIQSLEAASRGNAYRGNILEVSDRPGTVLLDIVSGPGADKTVEGNSFVFSGSGGAIAGVVGLRISGANPFLTVTGNAFDPHGPWVGGAGTAKIVDVSTAGGSPRSGEIGVGLGQTRDGAGLPAVWRGALTGRHEESVLTQADVTAGVLALSDAMSFDFTPTVATNVSQFDAPHLIGKRFGVLAGPNATFVHGSYLKLPGGANLTAGASGTWLEFVVVPRGSLAVAYLVSSTSF